jgi:DNA invertase Pin-like site-specific DNA recombinase
MVGAMQMILDLDRLGVQVVSVREPWLDTSGPVRFLLVAIFGWISEQERLRISERTRAGLDRARRRGVRLGRTGFDIDADRARALRESGMSYRQIAAALRVSVGEVHETLVGRRSVRECPGKARSAEADFVEGS